LNINRRYEFSTAIELTVDAAIASLDELNAAIPILQIGVSIRRNWFCDEISEGHEEIDGLRTRFPQKDWRARNDSNVRPSDS